MTALSERSESGRLPHRVRRLLRSVAHGVLTPDEALDHGELTPGEQALLGDELAKGLVPVDVGHA